MPRFRFLYQTSLCLFVAGLLTTTGCDPANMGGMRGVVEKVGAKVVSKSSDEDIRKMFEKTNDQCPIKMDAYTTLERVIMVDEKNVEFHYKVNDKGRKLVKGLSKDRMRENAVEHMRGNAMAVAVAERDLSIQHIYEDRFGGHVLSYTINKAVLNGQQPMGQQKGNPFAVNTVKAKKPTETAPEADDSAEQKDPDEQPEAEESTSEDAPPVVEEKPQAPPKPRDLLPQQYKPAKRTRDNPAGIQANPFYATPAGNQ